MTIASLLHLQNNCDGVTNRRAFLRSIAVGTAGVVGFKDALTLQADELRKRGMSCILLFMQGGPSQLETFDPKPGHANGGPTKAIDTAVSGIQVAEHWSKTAAQLKDIALIRSMKNREGEHQRAVYQLHTGYIPAGGIKHPSIGALVAAEIGPEDFDLPHFVGIGGRGIIGSGFLGARYAPFGVANPNQMPSNAVLPPGITANRFDRRLGLLTDLEEDFAKEGGKLRVEEHQEVYNSARQMVLSPKLKAFDLSQEKASLRDQYGRTTFGQGCLLARRLVEAGVTFVEVGFGNWDTHDDNFARTKTLSETVDPAFGALIADLKDRGRLDRTLVVWLGEFGRTPRINARTGRDHFPRAFNAAVAGGGVKGGQVIGSTSADGTDVKNRPVTVPDLFCSFCHSLGVNPRKENIGSGNRPIKIVDGGAVVNELFA